MTTGISISDPRNREKKKTLQRNNIMLNDSDHLEALPSFSVHLLNLPSEPTTRGGNLNPSAEQVINVIINSG